MALTIYNSISRYCFQLLRNWKLENVVNDKEISVVPSGTVKEVVYNFENRFPGKLLCHLTFNRNFGISLAKW